MENKELNGVKMMIADGIVTQEAAEKYFPELKKSKDERTQLTEFLWDLIYKGSSFRYKREDFERWKDWLEKQGEKKPADKVEPKLKKGEFVVDKEGHIFEITRIDKDYNGITYSCRLIENPIFWSLYYEDEIRLWDITKDAKSGDVLASNCSIFIFSQEYMAGKPEAHCGIMNGLFIAKPEGCWTNEKIYPATKEQRYFLFTKIREAGYKWDEDRKELKKIDQGNSPVLSNSSNIGKKEQKSTDKIGSTAHNYITPNKQFFQWIYDRLINVHNENPNVDYMLSLKERIENMQKTAWSEEDSKMIGTLVAIFEVNYPDGFYKVNPIGTTNMQGIHSSEIIKWLKSLKNRITWKPSSIQMECLHDAIEHYHTNGYPATKLTELYEQMSKIYKL